MAFKIEHISTEKIFKYLEILEHANLRFQETYQYCKEQLFDNKKIRRDFLENLEKKLSVYLENNNKVIDNLEKELFRRMRKELGIGIALPNELIKIQEDLKKECLEVEKEVENKTDKVKTLTTKFQK